MNNYSYDVYNRIKRDAILNDAEKRYRKRNGLNPSFPWSEWGDRPRSGALWTPKEIEAVSTTVKQLQVLSKNKLDAHSLSVLAWNHGRSAIGVREKLIQLMRSEYYQTFEI